MEPKYPRRLCSCSNACRVERVFAEASGQNDVVAPLGANPRELLYNLSGSFFFEEEGIGRFPRRTFEAGTATPS